MFLNRTTISKWITVNKLQSGFQPTSHEPAAFRRLVGFSLQSETEIVKVLLPALLPVSEIAWICRV
jgi:AraC-like DNA-binding protein